VAKLHPPDPGKIAVIAFASIGEYAIFTSDLGGLITTWNAGAEKILGYGEEEILGQPCDVIFTPEDRARGAPELERRTALRDGRAEDLRWHLRKDGSRFWGSGNMMSLVHDGVTLGFVKVLRDETERKHAEEQRQLLLAELNHRVKNTLATVQSIAAQTLRAGGVPNSVRESLEARLASLSEAHNILTRESWEGAGVWEIVRTAVAAHLNTDPAAARFHLKGADVWVPPRIAVALALALHELATNALKYGSLSVPQGEVEISWDVDGPPLERFLRLEWRETGGPPVKPPEKRGFGSRLIENGLAAELGGAANLDFRADGLRCEVRASLDEVTMPKLG
jgi:PAS domain S-box-containing protein